MNPDIVDIMVEWAKKTPGLKARRYDNMAQFFTGSGYNNYKKVGVWLASCEADLFIWGPETFGDPGGFNLDQDGNQMRDKSGQGQFDPKKVWLKAGDPEFFIKLHKVLFRFHKKERKP